MISVIVPVYNAQNYLSRCVESILTQTHTDYELILVDDGSTDKSPAICDKYAENNDNIRVFHQSNSGPSKARNCGIRNAKGTYISFVDADDYIAPDMLQKMYEAISSSKADIVVCNYATVTSNGDLKEHNNDFDGKVYEDGEIKNKIMPCFYDTRLTTVNPLWNKIYKTEFIIKNELKINEALERAEDFWFNFDAFKAAKKVRFIDDVLYYYWQGNRNSIMHKFRPTQYEDWVYNKKELLRRNDILNIDIDYVQFYGSFVYKVIVYLRDLVKMNYDKSRIFKIMGDDFFLMSLSYCRNLPKHIRLICKSIKLNKQVAYFLLKLWR